MANIFIVSMSTTQGPYGPSVDTSYHHNEVEAQVAFGVCMDSVGEDPTVIELVRLDTETLDATSIRAWEGTMDDLEEEFEEDLDESEWAPCEPLH